MGYIGIKYKIFDGGVAPEERFDANALDCEAGSADVGFHSLPMKDFIVTVLENRSMARVGINPAIYRVYGLVYGGHFYDFESTTKFSKLGAHKGCAVEAVVLNKNHENFK